MEGREATRLASSESPVMMIGSDAYGSTFQNSSVVTPPQGAVVQQTRIPFSSVVTSASKPPEPASPFRGDSSTPTIFHGMNLSEPLKKKRGRPRKYGPDGTMALALSPLSSVPSYSTPSFKRNRGRPPGSGKRQQLDALGNNLSKYGNLFTTSKFSLFRGSVLTGLVTNRCCWNWLHSPCNHCQSWRGKRYLEQFIPTCPAVKKIWLIILCKFQIRAVTI